MQWTAVVLLAVLAAVAIAMTLFYIVARMFDGVLAAFNTKPKDGALSGR